MINKIKVLVVDDSAFMRKIISDIINKEPDLIVIGTARDGEDAITKAIELKPDIITLDVEMPRKNGLEALKEIKKSHNVPVIMVSSLTSNGSIITIEALREGAFDFIQKPSGSISLDMAKVGDDLIGKIRLASKRKPSETTLSEFSGQTFIKPEGKVNFTRCSALAIAASTGGPRVLFDLITSLPNNLDCPIFIVQHMPAGFTKAFAERIDKSSSLKVKEAAEGDIIEDNVVYIAPGGFHMEVHGGKIRLSLTKPIHGVRPAADILFNSLINHYRSGIVACVLTGMGKDGAEGAKNIKSSGGYIIAQNEFTSTVFGMPKATYEQGCVDVMLPDKEIPNEILRVIRRNK